MGNMQEIFEWFIDIMAGLRDGYFVFTKTG
jgi:hypothetical protein